MLKYLQTWAQISEASDFLFFKWFIYVSNCWIFDKLVSFRRIIQQSERIIGKVFCYRIFQSFRKKFLVIFYNHINYQLNNFIAYNNSYCCSGYDSKSE